MTGYPLGSPVIGRKSGDLQELNTRTRSHMKLYQRLTTSPNPNRRAVPAYSGVIGPGDVLD